MNSRRVRYCLTVLILISGFLSVAAIAVDTTAEKVKLEDISNTLKAQQAALKAAKMSRKELLALQESSAKAETEISQALLSVKAAVATQAEKLANLTTQEQEASENQAQHMAVLVTQLRAIQRQAQPNYLQALLSQDDPTEVARGLTYYRYFHQARAEQMTDISEKLAALTAQKQEVVVEHARYQDLFISQQEKQRALAVHNAERQAAVAVLDKTIASQDSALSALQTQQKKLQELVKALNKKPLPKPKPAVATKPTPKPAPSKPATANAKGRQWPLKGKTLARYGSRRSSSKLKWRGMMIGAKMGQQVSAAASGHVVFADWMRGFGSLLIIDHGNNYMTLYGNNQALLRKVGDKVAVGDLLAYSGNDGIRPYAGLYFEVRKKGEPIDPVSWLK